MKRVHLYIRSQEYYGMKRITYGHRAQCFKSFIDTVGSQQFTIEDAMKHCNYKYATAWRLLQKNITNGSIIKIGPHFYKMVIEKC